MADGLIHTADTMPGIRRFRRGQGFAYRTSSGQWLSDPGEIQRIRKLAIPPAYRDVWICPLPNGHLQATGRDARGRKQYRYHPAWRESREADKFGRMLAFGQALPRIRARVERDLRPDQPLSRELVLATVVRLLDTTLIRVGNDEYARGNGSYGLTTLRNPHASVRGTRLRLSFRGKSGVAHEVTVDDKRLARVVRRCQDLPGQELFQYPDAEGNLHRIGSADVNDYLHEAAGERFTAKDFRTWHGSVLALSLTRAACAGCMAGGRFNHRPVLQEVSCRLRNTPAVCKKSYVHPSLLALWDELETNPAAAQAALAPRPPPGSRGLQADERRLLAFLRRRPHRHGNGACPSAAPRASAARTSASPP
jgi:DNA topoisomerase I